MTIEINGMAHVILTVSRFEVAREFYRKLLPEFGMKPVFDGDKLFYCVGGRTAIGIEPCDPPPASERFVQQRVGLHHLCLRARSREDVDRCASVLKEMATTIIRCFAAGCRGSRPILRISGLVSTARSAPGCRWGRSR